MAKPFLKWAGGKTQLLPQLLARTPTRIGTYYEPFLGGGALFFALQQRGRFERAALSDLNAELVNAFVQVRDAIDDVIAALEVHQSRYKGNENSRADYFYSVRSATYMFRPEQAARTIFLNKTCFNGLYRVNNRGEFNVPHGRYANPTICDETGLRDASAALQGVTVDVRDFGDAIQGAMADDFVYFDPPYVPISDTASFTAYTADSFGISEQRRLATVAEKLVRRDVDVLLSNSNHPTVQHLYDARGFPTRVVAAGRAINSVGTARGRVGEYLIGGAEGRAVRRTPASIRDRARRTNATRDPARRARWRSQ